MISPLAHEAIVRISHGIPSAIWLPFLPLCLFLFLFLFLSLLFWRPLIPFLLAGCNDTAIGGTLSRARSLSSWIYGWIPRRSHIVICLAVFTNGRRYASSAVALVCGACGCSQMFVHASARGAFSESERTRCACVLKRRNIPGNYVHSLADRFKYIYIYIRF